MTIDQIADEVQRLAQCIRDRDIEGIENLTFDSNGAYSDGVGHVIELIEKEIKHD